MPETTAFLFHFSFFLLGLSSGSILGLPNPSLQRGVCENSSKVFTFGMVPKKRKNVDGSSSSSNFDATLFPSLAKSKTHAELFANRAVGYEQQIDDSFKLTDEGAINRCSLQQSEANITEEEDEEDDDEAVEGEQHSVSDRLTRLENEVHALNDNINSLNANITALFTFVDESLAAILARSGHQ
ncbi:hypothetical protein MRB53_006621 [Persea americana]|uniref:Uncharacterized protein n=1 Tax=Persea americana TaxID=3435 RepID=A0ACC2MGX6_PERAE|nr:hypothetical protein MRB53_006621 [Persea americana]